MRPLNTKMPGSPLQTTGLPANCEPLPAAALSPCDWMSITAETVQCHSNSDVPSTHSSDT